MEDIELKKLWQAYDGKLEKSMKQNLFIIESIQTQKARSKLISLVIPKILGIIAGLVYVLFLGFLLYANLSHIYFAVSVGMIIFFTGIAAAGYIKHIALIRQINYSESITDAQKKLAILQSSIVNSVRFLWLQLPFYTTFYISNEMIASGGLAFWIVQIISTGLFSGLAIWLYKNISYRNLNRKWVRAMINGSGGASVSRAMDFLHEIEEFKQDG